MPLTKKQIKYYKKKIEYILEKLRIDFSKSNSKTSKSVYLNIYKLNVKIRISDHPMLYRYSNNFGWKVFEITNSKEFNVIKTGLYKYNDLRWQTIKLINCND